MSLNDVIAMQQEQSTERTEWTKVDAAYPWVIGHKFFPMAFLVSYNPEPFKNACRLIAEDLEIDVETVEEIVLAEANR